ncbi:hypothetical protein P152DRAFT_461239 [Eremomyces bilateralis CBS 781.70]|uniref:Uncharacterized protein n=1 Tax=Eremomyces bilateralis CBS 781.70 TaxID=1392243 RepID=A0A6G1FVX8_9PEZI|nr:uncharacterized protein P152DRAFT_461239 [Eremomyces bilateralis CBS 781.70]KAF1809840.1 hypothetical protein P152DRAFT_461239 [Eremomyces bilateralis CBS 781.70]
MRARSVRIRLTNIQSRRRPLHEDDAGFGLAMSFKFGLGTSYARRYSQRCVLSTHYGVVFSAAAIILYLRPIFITEYTRAAITPSNYIFKQQHSCQVFGKGSVIAASRRKVLNRSIVRGHTVPDH